MSFATTLAKRDDIQNRFCYPFRVNHVYHIWLGFYDIPIGTISFHNDKSKFMFAFMYLEDLSNPVTIITVVMGKMMKCIAAMWHQPSMRRWNVI